MLIQDKVIQESIIDRGILFFQLSYNVTTDINF